MTLQDKNEMKKLKNEIQKLKQENMAKSREISVLNKIVRSKDEVIEDIEKLSYKNQNNSLKRENGLLKDEINSLKKKVEKLKGQLEALANRLKKDSNNSSKPPSTESIYKKKKCVNTSREKTDKKVGGQVGHKGHHLSEERALELINSGKVEHVIVEHRGDNGISISEIEDYLKRYIIDLEFRVVVREHRFYGIKGSDIPEEYRTVVQYGDDLKTFIALQINEGFVSINRLKKMLSEISGGAINLSEGTIVNISKTISKNLTDTVEKIKDALIKAKVLHVDETGARVNGELKWVHTATNELYSYFHLVDKRGQEGMKDIGIIEYFVGTLVHDHWESYYKYETMTHAECNAHILRYLKYVIEIFKREGAEDFLKFLIKINNEKQEYLENNPNAKSFSKERQEEIEAEYVELLGNWEAQHLEYIKDKEINQSLRDESNLFKRLKKYKENHLMFVTDFEVPFSNNTAEISLRMLKTKLKVSGCFRGEDKGNNFLRIRSFIDTCKKHGKNVCEAINKVLNKEEVVFENT